MNFNNCSHCSVQLEDGDCYFVTKSGQLLHPGDCFRLATIHTGAEILSFQQMGTQLTTSHGAKLDELTSEIAKLSKAIDHIKELKK